MTPGRLTRPVVPALAVFAALLAAGCGGESRTATPREYVVPTTGRAADTDRMSTKDLHTFAAVSGVLAGARVGQAELAARAKADAELLAAQDPKNAVTPVPPVPAIPAPPAVAAPHGQTVIRVSTTRSTERVAAAKVATPRKPAISLTGIKSDQPHNSKEAALQDALQMAQMELMKELQKLDPPVLVKPSIASIRAEYLRKDGIHEVLPAEDIKAEWKSSRLEPDRLWVKVDIEVSEDQVQRLRAGERVNAGLQIGGVLFAILLAAYGFLRLDAWTKGYLTSWLAIGAVALVVIAVLVALS